MSCSNHSLTDSLCVYEEWVREFAPDVYKMLQVNEGDDESVKYLPENHYFISPVEGEEE